MKTIIQQRISALRESMKHFGLGAYIIPSSDPHLSEYPADCWKSRQWISGFTGSAGTVVVTADKAGLWTDSRYFLQASKELEGSGIELYKAGLPETPGIAAFLLRNLNENETVGLDGQTYSVADAVELNSVLKKKKISLDVSRDLIHAIWKDRPALPGGMLFELPIEYSGKSTRDKLDDINTKLHEAGADGIVLSALDEIAWTFNIRGNDVEYNPVVVSYAFISEEETVLFVLPGKLTSDMAKKLQAEGVILADYTKITSYLAN